LAEIAEGSRLLLLLALVALHWCIAGQIRKGHLSAADLLEAKLLLLGLLTLPSLLFRHFGKQGIRKLISLRVRQCGCCGCAEKYHKKLSNIPLNM